MTTFTSRTAKIGQLVTGNRLENWCSITDRSRNCPSVHPDPPSHLLNSYHGPCAERWRSQSVKMATHLHLGLRWGSTSPDIPMKWNGTVDNFTVYILLTSDNSLVSSVLGTEVAGFRGDSKCPRKLLNEKSATWKENFHQHTLKLITRDFFNQNCYNNAHKKSWNRVLHP